MSLCIMSISICVTNYHDLCDYFLFESWYLFFFFQLTGHFFFKYRNFTNWNILDRCTNLTFYSLKNSPVLWTIFNNVTCNNSRVNYKIARELYLLDRHAVCLNGMDIFNVTVPIDEYFELYCGKYDILFTSPLCFN